MSFGPVMNQIQNPRWNSPLVRSFGLRIPGAAAPSLAPEIAPSFDVNQQDDATLFFLRGEKRCSFPFFVAAAVGNPGFVQVRNPTSSGVLLVIDWATLFTTAGCVYAIRPITTDLNALAASSGVLDARYYNQVAASLRYAAYVSVENVTPGVPGGLFTLGRVQPSIATEREIGAVLPPGWAFFVYTDGTNAVIQGTIAFRERVFQPEELATG